MNNIWISDKILNFINLKSQIPNIFPKSQIILPPKSQIPIFLTPQIPNPKYHNTPPPLKLFKLEYDILRRKT